MEAPNPTWQALRKLKFKTKKKKKKSKTVRDFDFIVYIYIDYGDGASKNILIQVVVNSLGLVSSQ